MNFIVHPEASISLPARGSRLPGRLLRGSRDWRNPTVISDTELRDCGVRQNVIQTLVQNGHLTPEGARPLEGVPGVHAGPALRPDMDIERVGTRDHRGNPEKREAIKMQSRTDLLEAEKARSQQAESGKKASKKAAKEAEAAAVKEKTHPAVKTVTSPWTLDPAELLERSIDDLNALIAERDPDAPSFDNVDKAIEFLSRDHSPES